MSQTYKTCAIVLKSSAMGEADRLLTLLSPDRGIFKAIAPGSRKPKSKLGGRTALFVVNDLFLVKGRSLDKLIQADVQMSYPGLSRDLAKLTTAQYWAELALAQGLNEQPQAELFNLLITLLSNLESALPEHVLMLLVAGIYQFLRLAGITPQLKICGLSQKSIPATLVQTVSGLYFSFESGGTVMGEMLQRWDSFSGSEPFPETAPHQLKKSKLPNSMRLSAQDYHILCYLDQWASRADEYQTLALDAPPPLTPKDWLSVEKILRGYTLHYFDRPIKSANLIESAFSLPHPFLA